MRGALLFVVAVVVLAVAHARPAHACGGLFCSAASPVPVDQTAERILFEVEDDGTITVTVEISYTGDPESFSWIVPVPETPTLDVVPADTLRAIDGATQPVLRAPQPRSCPGANGGGRGGGGLGIPFGCMRYDSGPDDDFDSDVEYRGPDVTVENLPRAGPYDDIVVVESTSPDELIAWLDDNQYVVTPPMEPIIAGYVEEGFKFLAVKLAADAGVADIAPLRFTCPGLDGAPFIPLRLTAVSAAPEMSVVVMIAAAGRYAPVSFREIEVPTEDIKLSRTRQETNYYELLSWRIDQAGGRAFITEFAGPSEDVRRDLRADQPEAIEAAERILASRPFVTRLYTRISGWEMEEDPVFLPNGVEEVARQRVLPEPGYDDECFADRVLYECRTAYCGVGSECAVTESGAQGCACAAGTYARRISSPLAATVFCQPTGSDVLAALSPSLAAVCEQATCGEHGACRVLNGFATCECDEGYAAVVTDSGAGDSGLRCEAITSRHGPESLIWPDAPERAARTRASDDDAGGCDSTSSHGPKSFAFFLAMMWSAWLVARRLLRRAPS